MFFHSENHFGETIEFVQITESTFAASRFSTLLNSPHHHIPRILHCLNHIDNPHPLTPFAEDKNITWQVRFESSILVQFHEWFSKGRKKMATVDELRTIFSIFSSSNIFSNYISIQEDTSTWKYFLI